jgi:hypothetical protein
MGLKSPVAKDFRRDMQDLENKMRYDFHEELLRRADELIGNMRRAIDHSVSGALAESVRKVDVSQPDKGKLSVLVMAGGRSTTKNGYDYALAEEFGTTKQNPRPFFYSTARFYQQIDNDWGRETLEQAIAENERTRTGLRRDNYQDAGNFVGHTIISHSGPGNAVQIQTSNGKLYT